MPESLQITYEDSKYWIYLSTDATECFVCKQKGHIAKLCPQNSSQVYEKAQDNLTTNDTETNNSVSQNEPSASKVITNKESLLLNESLNKQCFTPIPALKPHHTKNTAIPDYTDSSTTEIENEFVKPKYQKKKKKRREDNNGESSSTSIKNQALNSLDDLPTQTKETIEKITTKYTLDFKEFNSFLINTDGQQNVLEISKQYTKDSTILIKIIEETYPHIDNRHLKSKLKKLKNKLSKAAPIIPMDTNLLEKLDSTGTV